MGFTSSVWLETESLLEDENSVGGYRKVFLDVISSQRFQVGRPLLRHSLLVVRVLFSFDYFPYLHLLVSTARNTNIDTMLLYFGTQQRGAICRFK